MTSSRDAAKQPDHHDQYQRAQSEMEPEIPFRGESDLQPLDLAGESTRLRAAMARLGSWKIRVGDHVSLADVGDSSSSVATDQPSSVRRKCSSDRRSKC